MLIGINATAAVKQPRTGVEEYTYQLIKHLTMLPEAREHRFLLYLPPVPENPIFDFPLPKNFIIKELKWPLELLWTQIRLAWEMLINPSDIFFIPVHVLPFSHPKNSVVTIHGLEYEHYPQYYPAWHRVYLRWVTKYSVFGARRVIAISESTKKDLIERQPKKAQKISVVHHGFCFPAVTNLAKNSIFQKKRRQKKERIQYGLANIRKPYLIYLGRLEQKKNIEGILEAYKILKQEHKISHQLVLAGAPGYGYKNIKYQISNIKNKEEIIFTGYVSEDEKWQLLTNADIFLFPSFYEGFGLPVLEAQAAGAPVVTSFVSSLPEVAGQGALFVNPKNPAQIAEAAKRIIDDRNLRDRLIESGYENLKRFSWEKCARETLKILVEK
ncbi:glycosyltransferase family 4 protein [Patescibacteria group bacterium]|nr:glycosyltransferase family 4 protein [Patescibacteria group bacterium]